jgi:hypothetical protein
MSYTSLQVGTLFLFFFICLISCREEVEPIITTYPPCQNNFDNDESEFMNINEESRFHGEAFVIGTSSIPDTATTRRLFIGGFSPDCERRDELAFTLNLVTPGDVLGAYTISTERAPGNTLGELRVQIVTTLEQFETTLSSGTVTLSDAGNEEFNLKIEAISLDGDVIDVNSSLRIN